VIFLCVKCQQWLPQAQFPKSGKKSKKPVDSWCYPCHRVYDIERARRKGVKPKVDISLYDRFMAKVEKTESCWAFKGAVNNSGYASIVLVESPGKKRTYMAHRIAWELFNGGIPSGLCVLHKCDNRVCVRPDHLFLGTHKDNTQDCIQKGRFKAAPHFNGENHPASKLTAEAVNRIRNEYVRGSGAVLAKEFGVSQQTVSAIICGTHWSN